MSIPYFLQCIVHGFQLTANSVSKLPCSLRLLLQKFSSDTSMEGQGFSEPDEGKAAHSLVQRVLRDSLMSLEKTAEATESPIRWELGSSWMQHLQKQDSSSTEVLQNGSDGAPEELPVKGLGKQFEPLKKIKKKTDPSGKNPAIPKKDPSENCEVDAVDLEKSRQSEPNEEAELLKLLPEEAFLRLKDSGTGLHLKVLRLTPFNCFTYFLSISYSSEV